MTSQTVNVYEYNFTPKVTKPAGKFWPTWILETWKELEKYGKWRVGKWERDLGARNLGAMERSGLQA